MILYLSIYIIEISSMLSIENIFCSDISSLINSFKNNLKKDMKTTNPELEFRLGKYTDNGFTATLGLVQFKNIIEQLQKHPLILKETISLDISDQIRLTINGLDNIKTFCRTGNLSSINQEALQYITKGKSKGRTLDIKEYNIRLQLSSEDPVDENTRLSFNQRLTSNTEKYYRYKHRYSFTGTDNPNLRYDLTIIKSADGTSFQDSNVLKVPEKYEVEVELVDAQQDIDDKTLLEIYKVVLWSQNSPAVIKTSEQETIFKEYLNLISVPKNSKNLEKTSYFIGMDVLPLTLDNIKHIENNHYCVTDKADGERNLLLISKELPGMIYLINNRMEIKHTGLIADPRVATASYGTIFDGELVTTKQNTRQYLIFDCLFYQGHDIRDKPLYEANEANEANEAGDVSRPITSRYQAILRVINPNSWHYLNLASNLNLTITMKTYQFQIPSGDTIFQLAKNIYESPSDYLRDGLIFTKYDEAYPIANLVPDPRTNYVRKTRWETLYKWKNMDQLSIDFLVHIVGKPQFNTSLQVRYTEVKLMVQGPKGLVEFKPEKENANIVYLTLDRDGIPRTTDKSIIYHESVIEFIYDSAKPFGFKWVPIRFRPDKSDIGRPNALRTADSTWDVISHPVTLGMITGDTPVAKSTAYYSSEGAQLSQIVKPMKDFHNTIKFILFNKVTDKPDQELLDVTCGQGGDLPKWDKARLKYVLGVDLDKDNINEINKRKEQFHYPTSFDFIWGNSKFSLNTGLAGRDTDNQKRLQMILSNRGPASFDIVSCQFAIHYFTESEESLNGFLSNVVGNLKIGGYFIGTTLDGGKLFNLLEKQATVAGKVKNTTIWEIKKKYTSTKLEPLGQKIGAFNISIGHEIDEYLVNFEYLIKIAKTFGLEVVQIQSFEDTWNDALSFTQKSPFLKKHNESIKKMTTDEKKYSFMNKYFIFKKTSQVTDTLIPATPRPKLQVKRPAVEANPLPASAPAAAPAAAPVQKTPAPLTTVPELEPETKIPTTETKQCQCKTSKGTQCKNNAIKGSIYCRLHQNCTTHI
jgi:mRNA (guanine-N7-)-methyltransferase